MEMNEQKVREIANNKAQAVGIIVLLVVLVMFLVDSYFPGPKVKQLEQRITVLETKVK
jgi:hypothetical protein